MLVAPVSRRLEGGDQVLVAARALGLGHGVLAAPVLVGTGGDVGARVLGRVLSVGCGFGLGGGLGRAPAGDQGRQEEQETEHVDLHAE